MECRQSLRSLIIHEKNASVARRAAWIIDEGLSSPFIFAAVTGLNNFPTPLLKQPSCIGSCVGMAFSHCQKGQKCFYTHKTKETQQKSQTLVSRQEGLRFPHLSLLLPRFSALNFSAHLMSAVCPSEIALSSQRLWIVKPSGLACSTVRWVSPGQTAHNHISVCFFKIFSERVWSLWGKLLFRSLEDILCYCICTANTDKLLFHRQCIFKSLVHMLNLLLVYY